MEDIERVIVEVFSQDHPGMKQKIPQLVNGRYPGSTTFYTDDRCIVIPGDLVTVFFVAT